MTEPPIVLFAVEQVTDFREKQNEKMNHDHSTISLEGRLNDSGK
jgi:hypothetical protein